MVVFLQGCNLKCKYCQNPDTIPIKDGSYVSIDELVSRAVNMRGYFGKNGGVTVSGGEPMLQSKAIVALFKELKKHKIHTNIDTNGTITTREAQFLISNLADLIMFDVKHVNPLGFMALTDARSFTNLLKNVQLREENKKTYWLRYVLIPGYTDSTDDLDRLIDLFSGNQYLKKLEILPYHKLGIHKWNMMNWEYQLKDVKENTPEQLERAYSRLQRHFEDISIR
jgi:pyruvate formate lyase activating enzyme